MGVRSGVYRVLVRKPEGKRPLGIPRRRWEDNIKMDLQEVRCRIMDWIELAQDKEPGIRMQAEAQLQPAYGYHTPQPNHNVTPTHIEPEQYNT